jgi:hypothetical protein
MMKVVVACTPETHEWCKAFVPLTEI